MSARPTLHQLADHYDLVVIGGGITGAGVLREAMRTGAKVLLVEQGDYASGTSSRSSKLVHGGLRYLKIGQWRLTLESVRERERLLREAPDLVLPLPFLMPLHRGRKPGRWLMQVGLSIYDLMAGSRKSRFLDADEVLARAPGVVREGLFGGLAFEDAITDDARLVLRLIFDSTALGAMAMNYTQAQVIEPGRLRLVDRIDGGAREIGAAMVVNATGAWQDATPGAPALRPLRGSHFIFPARKWPLQGAVSWLHPRDARPIFALPWLGAVVFGTTDLDHAGAIDAPRMTPDEAAYLLEGLDAEFPALKLRASDAIATYAGVRPVVAHGEAAPSAESRESAIWSRPQSVSVTGGKLTTFHLTAREVLREAAEQVPRLAPAEDGPLFGAPMQVAGERIAETPFTWEGVLHALRQEHVVHLVDLMLRRTRLGLIVERGGVELLPRIGELFKQELGWNDARWAQEQHDYLNDWQRQHAPVTA
ncbi:MAG TPA: glycerol-3-phosphate dehydrogenase/oxidase [Luteimonas sp.]